LIEYACDEEEPKRERETDRKKETKPEEFLPSFIGCERTNACCKKLKETERKGRRKEGRNRQSRRQCFGKETREKYRERQLTSTGANE